MRTRSLVTEQGLGDHLYDLRLAILACLDAGITPQELESRIANIIQQYKTYLEAKKR